MLIGLLYTVFVILCFFIIFIVLLQKSKGSLGIVGSIGSANIIFGGSGGQDIFQKMTWMCIALFMSGSLVLALLKNRSVNQSRYLEQAIASSVVPVQAVQPQASPDPVEPSKQEVADKSTN